MLAHGGISLPELLLALLLAILTSGWFTAVVVPMLLIGVIYAKRQRHKRRGLKRGFEVITKPDSKMGQEARKE